MNGAFRFVLGAVGGAMLAFFGGQFVMNMIEPGDEGQILAAGKSHFEVETETWHRYGPKILAITLFGGLLGGTAATFLGVSAVTANHTHRRHRSGHGPSMPLEQSEFERIRALCLWVDLRDKSPDYVQGLIVGRLAEIDPALARRVDQFDELEIDMLVARIKRHKERIEGASGH
jgi:hypothetical protein